MPPQERQQLRCVVVVGGDPVSIDVTNVAGYSIAAEDDLTVGSLAAVEVPGDPDAVYVTDLRRVGLVTRPVVSRLTFLLGPLFLTS